jgi:hypothetical protein
MFMVQIGDIVYLHDHDTKASPKNVMRWCMVIAIAGSTVRVAPRSASRVGKVFTPQGLLAEFTEDGWFSRWALPVPRFVAEAAHNAGQLPEPERSRILDLFARRRIR